MRKLYNKKFLVLFLCVINICIYIVYGGILHNMVVIDTKSYYALSKTKKSIIIHQVKKLNLSKNIIKVEKKNSELTLTKDEKIRLAIVEFMKIYSKNQDPIYIKKVSYAYIKLVKEYNLSINRILYFVALCSVESNFDQTATSHCNAVGIAQVHYPTWKKFMLENHKITPYQLKNHPQSNIKAGYIIWERYLKASNYNIRRANYGYLGTSSPNYHSKINKRFAELSKIFHSKKFS